MISYKYNNRMLISGGLIAPSTAYAGDFGVPYWYEAPGLIMYDVKYKGTGVLVPIPSKARQRVREKNLANRPEYGFAFSIDPQGLRAAAGALACIALVGLAAWTSGGSLAALPYAYGLMAY